MEDLKEFAEEIASHALATGRQPREILQCMQDEGYIDFDDEATEVCLGYVSEMLDRADGQSGRKE